MVPVLPLASPEGTGAEAAGRRAGNRACAGRVCVPGTGPILADVYSRCVDVNVNAQT